ncbi:MAG TPA: hypothetical protein VFW38_05135 [Solirubrobacteraceae bacterium]|nr:hypothetical protein [Solirubrobacteraceae bacterium]
MTPLAAPRRLTARQRLLTAPRPLLMTVSIAAVAGGVAALATIDSGVLCVAPALLLCVPLLFRRYPGERLLAAVDGRAHNRRRRGSRCLRPGGAAGPIHPRGGLLIARHLAVRPPPALLAAS